MVLTFILGIASGIVASFLFLIIQNLVKSTKMYKQSEFSGIWIDEIYEDDTRQKIIKRDEYTLKHNRHNHTVVGTIRRYYPENQNYRKWQCNGVIYGGYMIICFWRNAPQRSNGCIYAKLEDDNKYVGYYLEEHKLGVIDKTPISLIKKERLIK